MVIPFLYDQSYYRNHQKWIRGDLQHGTVGVLEEYYRLKSNSFDDLFYVLLVLSIHSNKTLLLKKLLKKLFWKKIKKIKGGYSYIGGKKLRDYPTAEPILGLRKLHKRMKLLGNNDFEKLKMEIQKFDFCNFLFV